MSTASPTVIALELPELAQLESEPQPGAEVYERRRDQLRGRMRRAGLDVLAVYADREHFANSSHLTGFDPRFEEALVLLGVDSDATWILAGNESLSLVPDLPGPVHGVLCQALSLPGQDRSIRATIFEALRETALAPHARLGVVGWKPVAEGGIAVPQFALAGLEQYFASGWTDVTAWLSGLDGVRTRAGADQLALQEHRATRASTHVWHALDALAVGSTELEISMAMRLTGLPHACSVMCSSGATQVNGLRSPTNRIVEHGDLLSLAVGLWGGLASRAGRVVAHDDPVVPEHRRSRSHPVVAAIITHRATCPTSRSATPSPPARGWRPTRPEPTRAATAATARSGPTHGSSAAPGVSPTCGCVPPSRMPAVERPPPTS